MISSQSSLADICFAVSETLANSGIPAVLTGGSAAAIYAPQAYLSYDADFILDNDDSLQAVAETLLPIGFRRLGKSRIFSHPDCEFTVDFPKGPLAVGGDYVRDVNVVERGKVEMRILTVTDCIRDRLAHFYHWDDFTALNAAVAVAKEHRAAVDFDLLRTWTHRESPSLRKKLTEFASRLGPKA